MSRKVDYFMGGMSVGALSDSNDLVRQGKSRPPTIHLRVSSDRMSVGFSDRAASVPPAREACGSALVAVRRRVAPAPTPSAPQEAMLVPLITSLAHLARVESLTTHSRSVHRRRSPPARKVIEIVASDPTGANLDA